jgi:peptide/nickel transport system permease protein
VSETIVPLGDLQVGSRRRRRRFSIVMSLCFVAMGAVVVTAIVGPAIAPYDPTHQELANVLRDPSGTHWLGTDALGRDVFSRVLAGARTAFIGPLVIAAASLVLGNLLGLLAGYRGGRVDSLIMRWVDLMYALPALLVVIVVVGSIGGGYWLAVGILVLLTVPFDTRVARAATLEQVPRPYVEAAKALGLGDRRIMWFHIWPNISPVVVANGFLVFAHSLVALSALSFLGLGVRPGTADWGVMLAEGRTLLFANPVAALAPGAMIVVTAACMNILGDWLYERLAERGSTR